MNLPPLAYVRWQAAASTHIQPPGGGAAGRVRLQIAPHVTRTSSNAGQARRGGQRGGHAVSARMNRPIHLAGYSSPGLPDDALLQRAGLLTLDEVTKMIKVSLETNRACRERYNSLSCVRIPTVSLF